MAADMETLGHASNSFIKTLENVIATSDGAGTGSALNALRASIAHIQESLREASQKFRTASQILTRLAYALEECERDATREAQAFNSMPLAIPHAQSTFRATSSGIPEMRAMAARNVAASELNSLAKSAPWLPPEQTFVEALLQSASNTMANTASALKDEVAGLFAAGKFLLWDGTTQALVDQQQAVDAWQSVLAGIAGAASHPDEIVKDILNVELLQRDPAAWASVGLLAALGTKGLGRLAHTASHDGELGTSPLKHHSKTAVGIDRGDGRDSRGRYAGSSVNQGVLNERQALDDLAAGTGLPIIRTQVLAHRDGFDHGRKYDGLILNDDGTYSGIEVKSGSASKTAEQRQFDDGVTPTHPATAKMPDGRVIKIVQVFNLPG
ncbi:hypothetical protein O6072_18380 [Mycolicibacterium neoaurum]|uniref:hypothetical protein n=1 Tax=Mycolicibacterium neoaurum TaxID=1795 RepID=UPI00248C5513|nr:hypothetical protein [Mycolicibacterium neoaurum]WBP93211.1 hypothetical protein O7W24_18865 [Mycolicibacterium neoaurum]WBS06822.1 hypothetical protein O6072_18380 [Mycolicibacterium neoaurum]